MQAKLQKFSANKDKKDSIQFQLREEATEEYRDEIMDLRRYDSVKVSGEGAQSEIGDEGRVHFTQFEFQSINTSLSLCVTEKGIITTITFSYDDPRVLDHVIKSKLRNQIVTLRFSEGKNPFTQK